MTRSALIAFALMLAPPSALGQPAVVAGRVVEAVTGAGVPGASVQLFGTPFGVATDREGRFEIRRVPAGTYVLRASSVGFQGAEARVVVGAGARVEIEVTLEEATYQAADVVVTARRAQTATRSEAPVRLIPQSIAVVAGRVLEEQQARTLDEVVRNVSGVQLSDVSNGYPVFTLRGFKAEANGNFRKNGVEFAAYDDPFNANVERVEVLKGPASVLYGRLEPGGVINLVTKRPLSVPRAEVAARTGTFGALGARVDVTGPLAARRWLYRVNASAARDESFRDRADGTVFFLAPAVTWLASRRVLWTIEGEVKRTRRTVDPGIGARGSAVEDAREAPRSRFFGEPDARYMWTQWVGLSTLEVTLSPTWTLRSVASVARYAVDRDEISLDSLSLSGLLHRSVLQQPARYRYLQADVLLSGRLQTGPLGHALTLGLDASHLAIVASIRTPLTQSGGDVRFSIIPPVRLEAPEPAGFPTRDRFVEVVHVEGGGYNLGAFVQDQVALTGRLHALAALRLSVILSDAAWSALVDTPEVPAGESERPLDLAVLSPSAGLVYEPTPWSSAYLSFSRAFNPQINQVDERGEPFEPTYGTQLEAGAKVDLLGGALTGGIGVFELTKTNALTREAGSSFFVQTGEQRSRGVEVDLLGQPHPALTVAASYAYLDAIVAADARIPEGNRLPAAPCHSGSVWAQYAHQGGALQGVRLSAGLFAVGDRFSSLSNDLPLPAYAVVDVGLGYARADRFRVQLGVRNLFDAYYERAAVARQRSSAGIPTLITTWPGAPRSVRLSVAFRL